MKAYVIHIGSGWRSHVYASIEEAQAWINGYGVTQRYKDENYRVVTFDEYWRRRVA